MTKPGFKERIRQNVLKQQGLTRTGYGHIGDKATAPIDPRKTLTMRLIEQYHERPIEDMLMEGDLKDVGQKLGIDISTVSKWRLRLGLRDGN